MAASFPPNFDAEKACAILLDAAFYTDSEAAKRHDVSRRTVINYRKRLKTDSAFAQLFTQKLNELRATTDWEERLPRTLQKALKKMDECFEGLSPKNPESLKAITDAVAVLADTLMTLKMLDARLTPDEDPGEAETDRQVFAAPRGQA